MRKLLAHAGDWVRHERDLLTAFRVRHPCHWVGKTQHLMHLAYFGMVFVEGHTMYAQIAGGLLVLGVASLWSAGEAME